MRFNNGKNAELLQSKENSLLKQAFNSKYKVKMLSLQSNFTMHLQQPLKRQQYPTGVRLSVW
ncbi:hypothetical protein C7N43_25090 [Sphingobacteriales bacterium UPWRP_1]|nr:hypothetical protein BVG80_17205 [Sphingobacteriales bacterium TSM_CSM]PSJ74236.1 hypothetical protein C7N43_25090 [Sphingobacteriales bacterium UPWRP_1]